MRDTFTGGDAAAANAGRFNRRPPEQAAPRPPRRWIRFVVVIAHAGTKNDCVQTAHRRIQFWRTRRVRDTPIDLLAH